MKLKNIAICKICGREFSYAKRRRRKPVCCSLECRRKAKTAIATAYFDRRYHEGPEFRRRRIRSNVSTNAKRRNLSRESKLMEILETLATMNDPEEIRAYLKKYVRLKSEYYVNQKDIEDGE